MELYLKPQNLMEFKNKIKQKYPYLTDDDLLSIEGKEVNMIRMVEYKLHKTKQEMACIIANL
jgi:hypothetical protein